MSDITVNNFKAFYEQIRPYLGAAHSGFTPIGTVISVMGTTAPLNYLACDGTVYNIADYTELAAYFNAQFGSSNFFGGNGTTTFAVPDLRGEFLRGMGTNSHANQGSGANVGVHQDGTVFGKTQIFPSAKRLQIYVNNGDGNPISNADKFLHTTHYSYVDGSVSSNQSYEADNTSYTTRPTNTSVLYCIASKNIFMDAGSNYSTEEQVVGTWIDGKPIYQKTRIFASSLTIGANSWGNTDLSSIGMGQIVNGIGYDTASEGHLCDSALLFSVNGTGGVVEIYNVRNTSMTLNGITVQYTKTTDA